MNSVSSYRSLVASLLLTTTLLSSCSLAPDFVMPETKLPEQYKEQIAAEQVGEWKEITPREGEDRGQWWRIFDDGVLSSLQEQAASNNPNLKIAAARVNQARAQARSVASTLLPTLQAGGNAVRAKSASAGNVAFGGATNDLKPYNLYGAGATLTYEVDLFARILDSERALEFETDAQDALYRSTLLALQADVASTYFTLRALDAERLLLRDTVAVREEAARIMQRRFDVGTVSEQDVSRTEADLAQAKADLLSLDRARAGYENALAVLLGELPSTYRFPEASVVMTPPNIPAGLPSTLLARRPDVAQAASTMQAANRRIGVARAAFFPSLSLTSNFGYESASLADLFKWSSRNWALGQVGGSALAMTIFDSGRTIARVDSAQAVYEGSLEAYRAQVLVAFADVENALSSQRLLAEAQQELDKAASASRRTLDLTRRRYEQGDVSYFEVAESDRQALAASRAAIAGQGARMNAAVSLIRALGGGWEEMTYSKPSDAGLLETLF
ncbi:MAG: efflux transporter outer membrane subunit [Alphaproteobacteria bacterium]|nr:efflux transporter outer membrane subunit [Alphaproteobacteria bacterium]